MEFWLSWQNNKEKLRLPILPPTFEVSVGNMNTRVNINEIGTINLIGKSDLREMTIETFFPNQEYYFCEYNGFPDPYSCVERIEGWRKSGKPIRLIVTDTNINIAFSIESFKYGEHDGSGDVYYSLELAEYVFTNIKQTSNSDYKPPSTGRRDFTEEDIKLNKEVMDILTRTDQKNVPNSYIVKPGDTLSTIAKRTTGNSANYKAIAEKNNIKNPNVITPGMELKL